MPGPSHDHRDPAGDPAHDVALAHDRVRTAEDRYRRPAPPTTGSRLRTFVRRWGWRAYALPILAVLTVAALLTTSNSSSGKTVGDSTGRQTTGGANSSTPRPSAPPTAGAQIALKGDDAGTVNGGVLEAAALPAGGSYTKQGDGTFRVLPGTTPKYGHGPLMTYSIDVERGVTGIDLNQFATMIDKTLADPRSWAGHGDLSLQRVDKGSADLRITLTSVMTTRKYCGYDTPAESSCFARKGLNGIKQSRVLLNVSRWVRGASAYAGDLNAYHIYMINHEDGHAFGHNHAHQCLPGGDAPVMMQQSFGLRETRTGNTLCSANPWPYPPGVKGTPGAEQLDTDKNNEFGRGD